MPTLRRLLALSLLNYLACAPLPCLAILCSSPSSISTTALDTATRMRWGVSFDSVRCGRGCHGAQDEGGKWVVEWDYESLLSLHSADIDMRVTRVGFLRYAEGVKPEEEEEVAKALLPFSCVPVFLEKPLATKFYRDFCKVRRPGGRATGRPEMGWCRLSPIFIAISCGQSPPPPVDTYTLSTMTIAMTRESLREAKLTTAEDKMPDVKALCCVRRALCRLPNHLITSPHRPFVRVGCRCRVLVDVRRAGGAVASVPPRGGRLRGPGAALLHAGHAGGALAVLRKREPEVQGQDCRGVSCVVLCCLVLSWVVLDVPPIIPSVGPYGLTVCCAVLCLDLDLDLYLDVSSVSASPSPLGHCHCHVGWRVIFGVCRCISWGVPIK